MNASAASIPRLSFISENQASCGEDTEDTDEYNNATNANNVNSRASKTARSRKSTTKSKKSGRKSSRNHKRDSSSAPTTTTTTTTTAHKHKEILNARYSQLSFDDIAAINWKKFCHINREEMPTQLRKCFLVSKVK